MNRFELLRYERGMTRDEVSVESGVSARTIARLESGTPFKPTAAIARRLSVFYGIGIADLLQLTTRLEEAA